MQCMQMSTGCLTESRCKKAGAQLNAVCTLPCCLAWRCRLTAAGGSRPAERRIRSFPLLEEEEEGGGAGANGPQQARRPHRAQQQVARHSQPAAAAGGTEVGGSGGDDDGEMPGLRSERSITRSSSGAGADYEDDALADDAYGSEAEEEEQQGAAEDGEAPGAGRSTGPPSLRSEADADSEQEGGAEEDAAAPAGHPRQLLPHADILLLGAVAVGELALRFLQLLGAPTGRTAGASGASGAQAAAAAAAGRLRELTVVPTEPGPARDTLAVSFECF